MTKSPGIALYNQDRFGNAEFVANFVARNELVTALLASLRHIADGGPTEHQILIGARGMGKTSLLRRMAIAITADPDLDGQFLPLRFREEQYNIISLDAFWRNCGESLAEYCEQRGNQALADQLDIAIDSPEWRNEDYARDAFLVACDQAGGRAVLLLDNLDLILDGIKNDGSWSLRNALQKAGGPIVIGAATQLLVQGSDRQAAFYEFFNPQMLEPLTERELLTCLNALADLRGEAGAAVKAALARAPERVRALYVLTGGNPRILALVYQLLEQADSETIFADLEALLDQVTPFYKARIEEYQTPLQRAVIDGIALNWDPITASALSKETGVEATTLPAQLNRLRKDGLIEEVETSGTRSGYQLAERFLNIWYLMRHGTRKTKQRLRWFTIFLTKLFSVDELQRMADDARDGAGGRWNADHCNAVIEAYELKVQNEASQLQTAANKALSEAIRLQDTGSYSDAIAMYDEVLSLFGGAIGSNSIALQWQIAMTLVNKGAALGKIGQSEKAITAYNEVIERFGHSKSSRLQRQTAMALFNKGVRFAATEKYENAIAEFENVLLRYSQSDSIHLQGVVANALINKSVVLSQLGRPDAEISVCDEVISRFGHSEAIDLQLSVARALINKGTSCGELGRFEEEISAYGEVVERFGASEDTELQDRVMVATVGIGTRLFWEFGRLHEGILKLKDAIRLGTGHTLAKANLLWMHVANGDLAEAHAILPELDNITDGGRSLMLAVIALGSDDLETSLDHLAAALDEGLSGQFNYAEDLLWYLRIAVERGHGERLVKWFAETGHADRYAPVYAALVAHVRGERFLLDINPEVRGVARPLFAKLSAGKSRRTPEKTRKKAKRTE